ncbi:hypothetical protein Hanom_Chr04g00317441 [Helianthus anomalus]
MQVSQEHQCTSLEQLYAGQEQQRIDIQQLQVGQDQIRANQDFMHKEVQAGFSYLFGGLHNAFPNYFGKPPQFSYGNPPGYGGAGPSSTGGDAGDDDE